MIGHTDALSKKMYRRIVDEGHTLGMHSYSHIYRAIYASEKSFEKDLDKIQTYLEKVTGFRPIYYRFPGGSSYSGSKLPMENFITILENKGISYLDWNVIDGAFNNPNISKEELADKVLNGVSQFSTSIVQLHDSSSSKATANALGYLIKKLKEEGYEILPIDENTTPIRHIE